MSTKENAKNQIGIASREVHPLIQKWSGARSLEDFLSFFVPLWQEPSDTTTVLPTNLFVLPSPSCSKLKRYARGCRQDLKSLLLDAVHDWSRNGSNNMLTLSFGHTGGTTQLVQRSMQSAIDFWLCQDKLHAVLGDDILRYVWSHPVLLALDDNDGDSSAPWIQVAGPLLWQQTSKRRKDELRRPRKKRKVDRVPELLRPGGCLYRKPLFYNNMYTKHVGVQLPSTSKELYADMMKEVNEAIDLPPSPEALEVCSAILHNHHSLDYHRLLERHCPLPPNYRTFSLDQLATRSICETKNVIKFCVAVVRKLLPVRFWGHGKNQMRFLEQTLPAIIRLRRNELFPNSTLIHGIRITYLGWLSEADATRRHHSRWHLRVLAVLRWLIHSYLFELLQRTFYITETQFGHQTLRHYRKPVWVLLRSHSWNELSQYTWLAERPTAEEPPFVQSELRLVPKESGVRPIALQKASNKQLAQSFAVLKHCTTDIGVGLQGLADLYPKYKAFLSSHQSGERFHFASVDIRHCFDNIRTDRLLELVTEKLKHHDQYILQKYFIVKPNGGAKMKSHVSLPEDLEGFNCIARQSAGRSHILVDVAKQSVVQSETVLEQITTLLERHVLQVKGRYNSRYLIQTQGVPQGNILSSLLCNLYYADVEEKMGLKYPTSLLVRMVDDFVLVSKDTDPVKAFLNTMERGAPELGVEINTDKTRTSSGRRFFSWCGLRFDTEDGNVRIDFSKLPISESLRVERVGCPGEALEQQVFGYCRPRCLPIIFDPAINSFETRAVNYYQILAFAAVRTSFHLKDLHRTEPVTNSEFLSQLALRTMKMAIHSIMHHLKAHGAEADFLRKQTAQWLGCTAFVDVFSQSTLLRPVSDLIGVQRDELGNAKTRRFLDHCRRLAQADMGLTTMMRGLSDP